MKLKSTTFVIAMMSVLILTTLGMVQVAPQVTPPILPYPSGPFEKYGPRVDRIIFKVAGSVVTEHDMFVAGEIDVEDWSSPAERWEDWQKNPMITMGEMSEYGFIYYGFHMQRWPLGHGDHLPPGWSDFPEGYLSDHDPALWPTESPVDGGTGERQWIDYNCRRCQDATHFRRALAHLANRDAQIAYMIGAGTPITSLIMPGIKDAWEYLDAEGNPLYPTYKYSLAEAEQELALGWFGDWDNDGTIEYSPDHSGSEATKEELPTSVFYTRADDDHRIYAGLLLSDDMSLLGIPHELIITSYSEFSLQCWQAYDFDIYIEYWDWGDPLPDIYSEGFHSDKDWYPDIWSDNNIMYHSKEYDSLAEYFTNATTVAEAIPYCNAMQVKLAEDAPVVPMYTYVGYQSHRTEYGTWPGETQYAGRNWTGMCNYPGTGFPNAWTHLNAHPEGFEKGGTLRQGLNLDPLNLDAMDAVWFYEGMVLEGIYDGLITNDPNNMTEYIPWLCKSFEQGTWTKPGVGTCSAINFTMIPGVLWQDGAPLTLEDIGFSFWFARECMSTGYWAVKDYDSYVTYDTDPTRTGNETIEIRYGKQSWLTPYWCAGVYIIPKHIWEPIGPDGSGPWVPEDHDAVFGTGAFRFYKDNIVGRVDRVPGAYLYLEPNPLYFRKYIWPDVCDATHTPSVVDEWVDGSDFSEVAKPDNLFEDENPDGTWSIAWGEHCDVNKDGHIGVDDLGEIGTHWNAEWPPEWYL